MPISAARSGKYWKLRAEGVSIREAAIKAGISESTGNRLEKRRRVRNEVNPGDEAAGLTGPAARLYRTEEAKLPDPIHRDRLCAEARRALDDFGYFRLRYFGRVSTPWQEMAAYMLLGLLTSEEREYVVMNMPPGSGKTTLIHDLICWLICHTRGIRILMGSINSRKAEEMLMRVRRSLERMRPVLANTTAKAAGHAFDAEATLARDYGRFRPLNREHWTREAFIVMQDEDDMAIEDKEPTVSAYGVDSGFIGGRYDFSVWDDLVDAKKTRGVEQREQMEEWYTDYCETRLEPGGMHLLVGQRLSADDLYRYALDMTQPIFDEDGEQVEPEEVEDPEDRSDRKYKHIVFKAHYEDRCDPTKTHKKGAPSYPEGCLLDARRLSWHYLAPIQMNKSKNFRVVYQQEDLALDETLVLREWITGAGDFLGCLDNDRERWEIPGGMLARDCFVIATADPSPTQYWSIQCWLYHEPSKQRVLLDHLRTKMEAPEFLQFDEVGKGKYEGIMEDWKTISEKLGYPISTWIVERDQAQRWLLQYPHVRKCRILHGVDIIPRDTTTNRSDPDFGVRSLAQQYRYGRVRLPWKGESKLLSLKLIDEVTKWPHGRTEDCVMAQWFFEWNLDQVTVRQDDATAGDIPSWMRTASSW